MLKQWVRRKLRNLISADIMLSELQDINRRLEVLAESGLMRDPSSLFVPPHPIHTLEWFEGSFIPQSMQFMIDLLPAIRHLTADWPKGKPMTVLDVGTGSGAGANLLATLYRSSFWGFPMKVDALDMVAIYKKYADYIFRDIRYFVGDISDLPAQDKWDLVICSATIEHVDNPVSFIRTIQSNARYWSLFYAPYKEIKLEPGHVNTFDDAYIEQFSPIYKEIIKSPAWFTAETEDARMIAFALKGSNNE